MINKHETEILTFHMGIMTVQQMTCVVMYSLFSEERKLGIYENSLYMKYQAIFGIILRKIQIGKKLYFSKLGKQCYFPLKFGR